MDCPAKLRGQDRQGFSLSVLAREMLHVFLPGDVVAEEQSRRLGEGLLEMDAADLGAPDPELPAR
jgi:hypothetical protein